MACKEAQINVRLPAELDAWVESRAGGKRGKPAFVRQILEREGARVQEVQMLIMFNDAWDSMSPEGEAEIREEREDWAGAYPASSCS